ncbi:MAG: glycosyltransferase family 39 protein [Solirubrobacteraceae bacterium]
MSVDVDGAWSVRHGASGRQRALGALIERRPSEWQIVLGLTVAAAALRFATLGVQSIWLDESATMVLVRRSLPGMLSHLSGSESAPPLYYVLVWVWTKAFGTGVLGFRTFSALAGTLTVPAMYAAGRHVSRRVAFWAATLTVVNPAMYYYSQEARCYMLLVLLSAVAFVYWMRASADPSRRNLALWSAASAAALLTHYFALFLFIPEVLLLAWRIGIRRLIAPAGAVILVGCALVPLAASQIGQGGGKVGWIEETPLASRVAETAKEFLVGVYGPLEIFSAVLAGLLVLGALALVARRSGEKERRIAKPIAIVAVMAVLVPLLPAAVHVLDVFDGRNVLAAWIPFDLLVAIGLGARRAGRSGIAIGGCMCVLSLAVISAINALPAYQRDDWRGAARAASATSGPGLVIVGEGESFLPLSIYLPRIHLIQPATTALHTKDVTAREVDFIALRRRGSGGRGPMPPVAHVQAPPGFHLVQVMRSSAYAVSRFVAPRPLAVSIGTLRRLAEDPASEVMVRR